MTYDGDFKDLTFIDKDGNFTLIPQKAEPPKLQAPARNTKTSHSKDLSKDEKWQSFNKMFRTFFGLPLHMGEAFDDISTTDILNSMAVMAK